MIIENEDVRLIRKFLIEKGFKPSLNGFSYLIDAIQIADDFQHKNIRMEDIYYNISEFYGKQRGSVERNIRFSISTRNKNLPSPVSGMTNKEALLTLVYLFDEWKEAQSRVEQQ